MRNLITLADMADFVAISQNIGPHLVSPYVRDAQTHDVPLPATVWAALDAALEQVQADFKPEDFATSDFATEATTAGWVDPKLAALWYGGVRPLLCCHASRRLLLWHGTHLTPAGLEDLASDLNRVPASSARRAVLSADVQAKCATYAARLAILLRAYLPTPATTTCCAGSTRRRPQPGGLTVSAL